MSPYGPNHTEMAVAINVIVMINVIFITIDLSQCSGDSF